MNTGRAIEAAIDQGCRSAVDLTIPYLLRCLIEYCLYFPIICRGIACAVSYDCLDRASSLHGRVGPVPYI